ncbi:MAG TPA: membrane dipeptidase [Solirubrobacteraceae bacterium]|jgi:microsomal dipeptidase-like Zn-dependent dipeptidase|nr:membrane dipeptidase [Solirubrobacteraceae bacterium]
MNQTLAATGFRVDALECSVWTRERFEEWRDGGLDCVNVTVAIWEDARDTLRNIGQWERLFRENADLIVPARSAADIRAAKEQGKTAVLIGLQNTSSFEDDLDLVSALHAAGVRVAQLTYNIQNLVGGGCWETPDPGLSSHFGRHVITEMNRVGMLIDVSHCGELTCRQAIDASELPIAITHGNPAEFVGTEVELAVRNRSTDLLKALAERGGMVGLSTYPRLAPDGDACTLERFCEMVAWTIDLLGIDHVGIGTDLYLGHDESSLTWWRRGRWAREVAIPLSGPPRFPEWMRTPADFGNLAEGLARTGMSSDEADQVLGGNWMRLFEHVIDHAAVTGGTATIGSGLST